MLKVGGGGLNVGIFLLNNNEGEFSGFWAGLPISYEKGGKATWIIDLDS